MRVLTAGTARACIHDLRFRDHFLDDQLLSTPHLYFLYFEDPDVIHKILTHLQLNKKATAPSLLPEPRAPPASDLFDTL